MTVVKNMDRIRTLRHQAPDAVLNELLTEEWLLDIGKGHEEYHASLRDELEYHLLVLRRVFNIQVSFLDDTENIKNKLLAASVAHGGSLGPLIDDVIEKHTFR